MYPSGQVCRRERGKEEEEGVISAAGATLKYSTHVAPFTTTCGGFDDMSSGLSAFG